MRNILLQTSYAIIFKHNQVHLQNDGKYILKYFLFYNENNYTKIMTFHIKGKLNFSVFPNFSIKVCPENANYLIQTSYYISPCLYIMKQQFSTTY